MWVRERSRGGSIIKGWTEKDPKEVLGQVPRG